MENGICGTKQDVDVDTQTANDTLMCMYAEFCSRCNSTAKLFAIHSERGSAVTVADLIGATRYNVMQPAGFVQQALPLVKYILKTGHIPFSRSATSSNLVSEATANAIFRHLNGARKLRQSKSSSEQLGNALYMCLLRGGILGSEVIVNSDAEVASDCCKSRLTCTFCIDYLQSESEWNDYCPVDEVEIYLKDYSDQIEKRLLASAVGCSV